MKKLIYVEKTKPIHKLVVHIQLIILSSMYIEQ